MNKLLTVASYHSPDGDGAGGGGAAAAAGAQSGDKGKGTPGQGAATFTQEQVDGIVAKVRREFETTIDGLKTQVDKFSGEAHNRSIKEAEAAQEYQKAVELRENGFKQELDKALKRADTAESMYREMAINRAIMAEAVKGRANDPEEIVMLLKEQVKLDSAGVPRFNDGSTIEDGVKKYLDGKPHHVQPTGRQGAGSSGKGRADIFPGSLGALSPEQLEQMKKDNPAELLRIARSQTKNPFARARQE